MSSRRQRQLEIERSDAAIAELNDMSYLKGSVERRYDLGGRYVYERRPKRKGKAQKVWDILTERHRDQGVYSTTNKKLWYDRPTKTWTMTYCKKVDMGVIAYHPKPPVVRIR